MQSHEHDLNAIIGYSWQDEANDFMNEGALADRHIFLNLLRMKIWLGREWYVESALKDYMYAESPFDLASEEDNTYRNLVDKFIEQTKPEEPADEEDCICAGCGNEHTKAKE